MDSANGTMTIASQTFNQSMRPYSDMVGRCDSITRTVAKNIVLKDNLLVREDLKMEGADIVFQYPNGQLGYLDVEISTNFYGGQYRSPVHESVSIPLRKTPFLQMAKSFWMVLSKERTHFILMTGNFILENGKLSSYRTKLDSQVKEYFILVHKSITQVREV